LQNDGKEEYDTVRPAFVVKLAENSGVPVVLEAKVEGFLGRQGDVDVLAERHPGCRLAEATVCGKGRDTIQYTGGTKVVAVLVGIAHLLVKAKQNNGDKKVLIPMRKRILERHNQCL
jgi:hypothetical protein